MDRRDDRKYVSRDAIISVTRPSDRLQLRRQPKALDVIVMATTTPPGESRFHVLYVDLHDDDDDDDDDYTATTAATTDSTKPMDVSALACTSALHGRQRRNLITPVDESVEMDMSLGSALLRLSTEVAAPGAMTAMQSAGGKGRNTSGALRRTTGALRYFQIFIVYLRTFCNFASPFAARFWGAQKLPNS